MKIDPLDLDTDSLYKILKGTIIPRPIGWISTISSDGIANLAPFSFFTVASRNPPILSVSILSRSSSSPLKDTLVNLQQAGEFVVNIASLELVDQMHATSFEHASETDEFEHARLEKADCDIVKAPRVAAAPVSMECVVENILPMGNVGDHVVFGRVVRFHMRDNVWLDRGRINVHAIQAVGRLAVDYCTTHTSFHCPVPEEIGHQADERKSARVYLQNLP